jgi:hypothetical protein
MKMVTIKEQMTSQGALAEKLREIRSQMPLLKNDLGF